MSTAHRLIGGIALALAAAGMAAADAVYLKDGFTLHGRIRREAEMMTDPLTGVAIPVIKGSNFFIIDDKVRWVIFDHRNVQDATPDVNIWRDFLEFHNPIPAGQMNQLPKSARVVDVSPFDATWHRTVTLQNELGKYKIRQRLTALNGYSAKIEANNYRWNTFYLTQELGLENVQKLLDSHPDLKETPGDPANIDKRLKRVRFLMQANWLLAAEEELQRAVRDFPDEKERIDRTRSALRQAQIRALWDEAKLAQSSGRHAEARRILTRIPLSEVDARLATDISALRAKVESTDQKIEQVRRFLTDLPQRLGGPWPPSIGQALPVILESLSPNSIERFESFLTLATQHEQERTAGKQPTLAVEDLLALAVTGYVLGNAAAEPKLAAADRLWAGREFVLEYLRTPDTASRRRLLEDYQVRKPLGLDEFAQLIQLMPPAEPAETSPAAENGLEERTTGSPFSLRKAVPYVLQRPSEYTPHRPWPVLIVVPSGGGERPIEALARWAHFARQHGYLLAAPQWAAAAENYSFSDDEHAAVLDVIYDLRRHFNVDSDRVFLAGYSDAGTIATDIGLSHPDQFAGVVTMNGRPRWSASMWYWHNAQYLPFYIVAGELAGDTCSRNRRVFENWMTRGYPSLMTIYKGRPSEFYLFELPYIFDWMDRKRRATGFPDLGRTPNAGSQGEEFQTARQGDNRFYWLEAAAIHPRYISTTMGTGERPYTPAALQATIRDGNTIAINTRGIKTLRVWLGQAYDPIAGWRPMVDPSRPVTFQVNRQPPRQQTVTPSLGVMLEDLYQRGDRQRLFWASVEFTNLQ